MSTAMEGGGHYNAHASAQAASATFGLDQIRDAATRAPVGPAGAVTIADYGASEGRNSLVPVGAAVEAVRRVHGEHQPIWVFHTDLPDNDFGSLFHTVADDPGSYRRPGVHTAAVGRSFYEQLLPDASVGLGWSSIAVHWLSAVPGPLERLPRGEGERGTVTDAERAAMTIPAWYRTAAEWEAPFVDGGDLVLEQLRLVDLGDPLWQQTRQADRDGAAGYPAAVAAALRVSFGPSLLQGLDPERRGAVATELFDGHLAAGIAAQPPEPWFDWRLAVMVVAKPR